MSNCFQLENERQSILDAKKYWRSYQVQPSHAPAITPSFRVGLVGSFTLEGLVPLLGARLLEKGFLAPQITVGQYHQIHQTCLNYRATFTEDINAILILWRIEDFWLDHLTHFYQGDLDALTQTLVAVDELVQTITHLRQEFQGTLIVSLPPVPLTAIVDVRSLAHLQQGGSFHRRVLEYWMTQIQKIPSIQWIDLDSLQHYYGILRLYDTRKWYLYRQPYREGFLLLLAEDLARLLAVQRGKGLKKCLVLDCDNTLWGGTIGEDGLAGIALGEDFPGNAFRDFQRQLVMLQQNGVFLALASKNNEADVWEVFDQHDAMVLKREHLAAARINWQPKIENLLSIAQELNILPESLVFIDDSRFEIAQVQETSPEITCLQVPEDLASLPLLLQKHHLFDQITVTSEDRERTIMVTQEKQRQSLKAALSTADFLTSLELKIEIFTVKREHLSRVTQLINKTNQFNLTTIRRTQEEVEMLIKSTDYLILALRASDRFGHYGLVGVTIIHKLAKIWSLDTFLLSCRILGRQIETALLATIVIIAQRHNVEFIHGYYQATLKNALVADFFSEHGFTKIDSNQWEARLEAIKSCPNYIHCQLEI
ncbi:MAG: hypothetical protein BWK79_09510 [Beggiatoa sp. IS2]|nr:MAG: hypothetical protein BWK79_09510 [Beggiatoa sp. IS2]